MIKKTMTLATIGVLWPLASFAQCPSGQVILDRKVLNGDGNVPYLVAPHITQNPGARNNQFISLHGGAKVTLVYLDRDTATFVVEASDIRKTRSLSPLDEVRVRLGKKSLRLILLQIDPDPVAPRPPDFAKVDIMLCGPS